MAFRVPAPDGTKGSDGLPLLVLPEGTPLKGIYDVARFLDSGGMSIVYVGLRRGQKFLLKEVEAGDSRKVIALTQEKAILERLSHPFIVKCYDLFEEDGFYYLVLDFIEGTSMDKLISPFPGTFIQEKVILGWALQICDIFEYLHRQNPPIIYRDLKPRNLVKSTEGKIHLIDFGIARIYKEGKSRDTEALGSALTASPEHYGGAQTDQRSDIYTLGATLHYLITNGQGQSDEPFSFAPVRSINPKVSENIERVVKKSLEFDARERYQNISEMRQALLNTREVPLPVIEPFGNGKAAPAPDTSKAQKTRDLEEGASQGPSRAGAQGGSQVTNRLEEEGAGTSPPQGRKDYIPVAAAALVSLFIVIGGFFLVNRILGHDSGTARLGPSPSLMTPMAASPSQEEPFAALITLTPSSTHGGKPSPKPTKVEAAAHKNPVPSASLAAASPSEPSLLQASQPASIPEPSPPQPTARVQSSPPASTEAPPPPAAILPTDAPQVIPTRNAPELPGATRAHGEGRSKPAFVNDGTLPTITPGEGVPHELLPKTKLYRDEQHNYQLVLTKGWTVDPYALQKASAEDSQTVGVFAHMPPPQKKSRYPDAYVIVKISPQTPGKQDASAYLEEWISRDERKNVSITRLQQAPLILSRCEAAIEVKARKASDTEVTQLRVVLLGEKESDMAYLKGMYGASPRSGFEDSDEIFKGKLREVITSFQFIR
ncbi:MAG: protein kinase [Candidatus Eremiobacteraeota bacterium]|nr:protein kinase [Candidatus Eremiobacteraeota bacterium]